MEHLTKTVFELCLADLDGWSIDPDTGVITAPTTCSIADLDGIIEALQKAAGYGLLLIIQNLPETTLQSLHSLEPELVDHLATTTEELLT